MSKNEEEKKIENEFFVNFIKNKYNLCIGNTNINQNNADKITTNFSEYLSSLNHKNINCNRHITDNLSNEDDQCGITGKNDIRALKDNSTSVCVSHYFDDSLNKLLFFTQIILLYMEFSIKYDKDSVYFKCLFDEMDIPLLNKNDISIIFKGGN